MAIEPQIKDHERTDANGKWVFVVVLGLAVCGLGLHGILAGFLGALRDKPPVTDRWDPVPAFRSPSSNAPFPRLQVAPPVDLQEFRNHEEVELHSYGWINRTAGVVRIPIERAMDLVLAQGLPVRSAHKTNQAGPSTYQLIQQRPEHRQPEIKGEK